MPTFARTEPPDTQVVKSLVALMTYYKWKKFTIVYEVEQKNVMESLKKEGRKMNMTINDEIRTDDKYNCCQLKLKCCSGGVWYQIIQETKNRTRSKSVSSSFNQSINVLFLVYVFLGRSGSLVDFMDAMQTAKMFENGEYFVISVDTNIYYEREVNKYIWSKSATTPVTFFNSM